MLFLMVGETDYTAYSKLNDAFRGLFALLDKPVYILLTFLYKLFFNVSTWEFFSKSFFEFFNRVQLIIGVYMIFQLAVAILRGILDPDNFLKNQSGAKGLVPRILTSLLMLVLLLPISTGGSNEFEKQIGNQGILFGTLSSLQYRIINNNTLGRLILGTDDSADVYVSNNSNSTTDDELDVSSRIFASTVLKGFYRINLIPENDRKHATDKTDDMIRDNRVCKDINNDVLNAYIRLDADPVDIINTVYETCPANWYSGRTPIFSIGVGTNYYAFNHFLPLVSTITGILFCAIMLSFTIDVAVRAIKLGVLRLLAPIPILGYMDPSGSRDESFNAWGKTLTSTYLDLFIRLSAVYFVIFLIQDMILKGIAINNADGVVGVLSFIAICVGLFAFAKQAPKFIREILGLKGEGAGLFSGFGAIGTAAGLGATALGVVGAANASRRASGDADRARYKAQLRENHPDWDEKKINDEANAMAGSGLNRAKHLAAAIAGGVGGGITGAQAFMGAKDHELTAVASALGKRNAAVMSAGRDGGTFFGGVGALAHSIATGQSLSENEEVGFKRTEQQIKNDQEALKVSQEANAHRKAAMDASKAKAAESDQTTGTYGGIKGNYRKYHSAFTAAQAGFGVSEHTFYRDGNGRVIDQHDYDMLQQQNPSYVSGFTQFTEDAFDFEGQSVRMSQAQSIDMGLLGENQRDLYNQAVAGTITGGDVAGILSERERYRDATGADMEADFDAMKKEFYDQDNKNITTSDALTKRSQELSQKRQGYRAEKHAADDKRFGGGGQ